MTIIGTKWVFGNKLDENGIVFQNKARLVAQGYNQQEGIDYNETYASVARLESIRILLAYACALDFKLFQMDVKSAFVLNGFIMMRCVCLFTDRWRLNELAYGIPSDGPYQTNLPSIEDIISSIRINRDCQVRRICHEEEIDVLEYQVLTCEIEPTLKPLEEIIRENVFCLGGNRDPVLACLCYMLYYVVYSERFNLSYFMTKGMEWVTKQKMLILPSENPEEIVAHEEVVIPLLLLLPSINHPHLISTMIDDRKCEGEPVLNGRDQMVKKLEGAETKRARAFRSSLS
ncbi:retrovirus-related pol polyprotein from transposon TNT 1-94 [Tanacetum coccineum]